MQCGVAGVRGGPGRQHHGRVTVLAADGCWVNPADTPADRVRKLLLPESLAHLAHDTSRLSHHYQPTRRHLRQDPGAIRTLANSETQRSQTR
jgi:hypothetical protein